VFTLAPAAFNVGNTLAPLLGGLTIDAGFGYASVAWVGAALAAAGAVAVLWAWRLWRAEQDGLTESRERTQGEHTQVAA